MCNIAREVFFGSPGSFFGSPGSFFGSDRNEESEGPGLIQNIG